MLAQFDYEGLRLSCRPERTVTRSATAFLEIPSISTVTLSSASRRYSFALVHQKPLFSGGPGVSLPQSSSGMFLLKTRGETAAEAQRTGPLSPCRACLPQTWRR